MQLPQDRLEDTADLRSAARKRFSEFFHGTSSVGQHRSRGQSVHIRKPSRSGLRCHPPNGGLHSMRRLNTSVSAPPRSPTSIRSVIDPSSSPPTVGTPLSATAFDQSRWDPPTQAPALEPPVVRRDMELASSQQGVRSSRVPKWHDWRNMSKGCLPTFKHKAVQKKFLTCVIFGCILILILVIYIAISTSDSVASQEFHVILILFILLFSVFLCHALIRFFMIYHNPHRAEREVQTGLEFPGRGGFAQPARPIRVILARDEEMGFGEEDEAGKEIAPPPPPPVYGLWRGSVRVDPNLLHWQKVERAAQAARDRESVHRPPSYISEEDEIEHPASSHVQLGSMPHARTASHEDFF